MTKILKFQKCIPKLQKIMKKKYKFHKCTAIENKSTQLRKILFSVVILRESLHNTKQFKNNRINNKTV